MEVNFKLVVRSKVMKISLLLIFSLLFTYSVYAQNQTVDNYNSATERLASESKKEGEEYTIRLATNQEDAAYSNRAKINLELKNYKEAIADYDLAIKYNPMGIDAYYNRGLARIIIGDYSGASTDMSAVIKAKPQDADAFFNRAVAKMNMYNARAAIQDFDIVLKIDAYYMEAYYYRGLMKLQTKNNKGACQDWQKAATYDKRAAKMLKKHCQ